MMFNRGVTASAFLLAGVAFAPLALAQAYPPPPGYSQPIYPAQQADPRGAPDFDLLDDDEPGNRGTSLPPPGFQQQPNYAPQQQQTYQQPGLDPRGPVMSPDDPRYGRPQAYQPNQQQPYQQQGSQDPNAPMRPPGAIDNATGAVPRQPNVIGQDGKPVSLSALPADEQPETGPRKALPERLRRQEVSYQTKEPAGTIIVDTPNTQLYYILGNGRAIRYGVRVGRDGFTWTGVQKITRKAEWPDWHPPTEMIERQPYLPRFMAGGDGNPLGARAMYLGATVYRIHGTNQPSTIGTFVSSGCIRLTNEDVTDLYGRVKVGTRVVVLPGGKPPDLPATASAAPMGNNPNGGYAPSPSAVDTSYNNTQAPRPNAAVGVPNQAPAAVPPLPAPVVIR